MALDLNMFKRFTMFTSLIIFSTCGAADGLTKPCTDAAKDRNSGSTAQPRQLVHRWYCEYIHRGKHCAVEPLICRKEPQTARQGLKSQKHLQVFSNGVFDKNLDVYTRLSNAWKGFKNISSSMQLFLDEGTKTNGTLQHTYLTFDTPRTRVPYVSCMIS